MAKKMTDIREREMCDIRLYRLLPLLVDEQIINIHVTSSVGECTICRTALEMKTESSGKRPHEILWRVSIYNQRVRRIRPNIGSIELWLERDDRE